MMNIGDWSVSLDPSTFARAWKLARGQYQRDILGGMQAVSGSTLLGKAACYRASYKRSRDSLFARMRAAGVPFSIETRNGRNILVIGV